MRPSAKRREEIIRSIADCGEMAVINTTDNRLRRGHRRIKEWRFPVFCLALVLLIQMMPVFANSGPPRILPEQNKVIFMENPGVSLLHEFIRIDWDAARYSAAFTVTYTFENTESYPQALKLWFMSGDYEDRSFRIYKAGIPVSVKDIPAESIRLDNWAFERNPPFLTQFNETTVEELEFYGQTQTPARVTEWTLELDSGERTEVIVVYEAKSGYLDNSDYFSVYRTLYYALSPAQFFDGDAVLDLELNIPENWSAAANLPLKLEAPGRYTLQDYTIGSEDLYLSLLNTEALMFGLNSRSALFGWTWPIAAVSMAAALFLVKRRKRIAVGLVIAGIAVLSLNIIRPSYGMIFMMIIFLPVVVVALVLLAAVLYVFRRRRKWKAEEPQHDGNKPMD